MAGIRIVDMDIYHPAHQVDNDFYIEHFDARGVDIRGLLKALGRDKRYKINNDDENSLSMAYEAASNLLEKTGLTGADIDLIAYASQTPEYIFPTNSLMIHRLINGASHTICIDSNANCAGMTAAFEQVSRQMLGNPRIRRALIIGSDYVARTRVQMILSTMPILAMRQRLSSSNATNRPPDSLIPYTKRIPVCTVIPSFLQKAWRNWVRPGWMQELFMSNSHRSMIRSASMPLLNLFSHC